MFPDESTYRFTPVRQRGWAPYGQRPTVEHTYGDWSTVSAISALAVRLDEGAERGLATQVYFCLHPKENVNSRHIRDVLHQVRSQVEGEVCVVWDRASHHRAKRVQRFVETDERFESVLLPAYCPGLNPDEQVWNWSKTKDLANTCPEGFDALVSRVRSSLTRIQYRPSVRRWWLYESEFPLEGFLT